MSAYKINMHLNSPTRDYVGNIFLFIKAMKIKNNTKISHQPPNQSKWNLKTKKKKTVDEEKKNIYLLCKL